MIKQFNLEHASEQDIHDLEQFFNVQYQLGITRWKKNEVYYLHDATPFTFQHNIISRARKNEKVGLRYEVMSNQPFDEGGQGTVSYSRGTLRFEKNLHFFKKTKKNGQRRLIKTQSHNEERPISRVLNEYQLLDKVHHLDVKAPTIVVEGNSCATSYLVMTEATGKNLLQLMIDNCNTLSISQRFELTQKLLQALQTQVIDKGITHRDIKPENIMVSLYPCIKVTIIDYGFALRKNIRDNECRGTPIYMAPEAYTKPYSCGAKSDLYSMARVIALLWGVGASTYHNKSGYIKREAEELLKTLFSHPVFIDLTYDIKRQIRATLNNMLQSNPTQRFTVEQARYAFDCISPLEMPSKKRIAEHVLGYRFYKAAKQEEQEPLVTHSLSTILSKS